MARGTSLDETAGLYHQGPEAFFGDWQDFTETSTPTMINLRPRVTLIARDFEVRTRSAFDFLQKNGLPVTVIPAADVIVTMGCGDACPVYPGKRYLDWKLDDPAGKPIEVVRPIVEEIDQRVQALLRDLVDSDA